MRILFMASLFAGLLLFVSSNPVIADVVGSARVIDGDTLEISGQRIRIHGIDAPEGRQTCTRGQAAWLCGHTSKAMRALVRGSEVKCEAIDTDRYGRIVGKCFANGRDVGEALVMDDLALAYRQYSTDYIQVEASAKAARRGLWAGEFVAPWDWRKGKRLCTRPMMRSRPRVGT